jgi:hypothetical protein
MCGATISTDANRCLSCGELFDLSNKIEPAKKETVVLQLSSVVAATAWLIVFLVAACFVIEKHPGVALTLMAIATGGFVVIGRRGRRIRSEPPVAHDLDTP